MSEQRMIMVSLTSSAAISNLAQRGGVLEQLIVRAGEDIRFVFFTAPVFQERLAYLTVRGTVIFEYSTDMKPRGLIAQSFRFFYSYLIFTGTTKILATFGARADRPPAGGNRHLAPLKWFIAHTFGHVRFIKARFTPWLYLCIVRRRPARTVFERYHPSLLFVPNLAAFPDIELVAEARRHGVRTIGMVQNWDHLNKYFIPQHVDYLLVQNEPMLSEAVGLHAYENGSVEVTGFPQFDSLASRETILMSREKFCEHFGIPTANRIVLYISGAAYSLDEPDILVEIARWIRQGDLPTHTTLMVRPYIIARDRAIEERKYAPLQGLPNVVFNWERVNEETKNQRLYFSMLEYADVIISIFSTTAIEAAIFDKPTLTIGFDGHARRAPHKSITRLESMSHFRHVLESGAVRVVRSFEDLRGALLERLRHPSLGREYREALVEKMCFKIDGRASERIARAVLARLNVVR